MNDHDTSLAPLVQRDRRRWLLGAVAGAAACAGAGLAWYRYTPQALAPSLESDFWQQVFASPQGLPLKMADLRGKPLLLNFWATWCPPCVEELPLLSGFYQKNARNGWQVLGLAVDQLEPVKQFLTRAPVAFPVARSGMPGVELSKSMGNLSGGLPFTVVMGSDGQVAQRKMGKVSPADLLAWADLK